jgi:hypothetical protein
MQQANSTILSSFAKHYLDTALDLAPGIQTSSSWLVFTKNSKLIHSDAALAPAREIMWLLAAPAPVSPTAIQYTTLVLIKKKIFFNIQHYISYKDSISDFEHYACLQKICL